MNDISVRLEQRHMDVREARGHVYRAPTPRERERWHALWLLARGWSAVQVADALERDPYTIGDWLEGFRQGGAAGLVLERLTPVWEARIRSVRRRDSSSAGWLNARPR